jgi:hypothetical protein
MQFLISKIKFLNFSIFKIYNLRLYIFFNFVKLILVKKSLLIAQITHLFILETCEKKKIILNKRGEKETNDTNCRYFSG